MRSALPCTAQVQYFPQAQRRQPCVVGLAFQQIKVAAIPVRSMVTPTSKGWTLANLLLELNTEHETVQGGNA